MKKTLAAILAIALLLSLSGCFEASKKDFSSNGFNITLTDDFYEKEYISATAYFESQTAIVMALKEEFALLESLGITADSTVSDYAQLILSANSMTDKDMSASDSGKYSYFEYDAEVSGKSYHYLAALYKSADAFWMVNFACSADSRDEYFDTFIKWADTVTFTAG